MDLMHRGGRVIEAKECNQAVFPNENRDCRLGSICCQKPVEDQPEKLWRSPVSIINKQHHTLPFTDSGFRPSKKTIHGLSRVIIGSNTRTGNLPEIFCKRISTDHGCRRNAMKTQS